MTGFDMQISNIEDFKKSLEFYNSYISKLIVKRGFMLVFNGVSHG